MIADRVMRVVKDYFPGYIITRETILLKDLGAGSLELMEFVFKLEDEFGVSITDNQMRDAKTVSDIINMMEHWSDIASDTGE